MTQRAREQRAVEHIAAVLRQRDRDLATLLAAIATGEVSAEAEIELWSIVAGVDRAAEAVLALVVEER